MIHQATEFGRELRKRRQAAGLTLSDLSQKVHYSKGQLSKVERGIKTPSRELVHLCEQALESGGALVALAPQGPSQQVTVDGRCDEEEVWLMQLSANGESWFQPVSRRQAMTTGAAAAVGLGIQGLGSASSAGTGELLEVSKSLFDHYRRLGQSAGSEFLLPALIAQTHTLRDLAVCGDLAIRRELLRLGSRYAEYVGWLVQETGNDRAALWWTQRAVDMAAAGGDHDLAAYAMVRRALVTLYRDDAAATVALAQQAQRDELPPRIRRLAAQREAQGHALVGDYDACMRSLDRARSLISKEDPQPSEPLLGATHLPDPIAVITGWCLYDLGRPGEAADVLDRHLLRMPAHAIRSQTRYGVRQALAHAAAGDIELACALARRLLSGAGTVHSATIAADLRRLARILARHPRNPAVQELSPELSTAPHVSRGA